jgi:hypothetical protein
MIDSPVSGVYTINLLKYIKLEALSLHGGTMAAEPNSENFGHAQGQLFWSRHVKYVQKNKSLRFCIKFTKTVILKTWKNIITKILQV